MVHMVKHDLPGPEGYGCVPWMDVPFSTEYNFSLSTFHLWKRLQLLLFSNSLLALHSYGWRTIRIIFLAYICKLFLLKTSLQHIKLKYWNVRWQKEAQPCHMPSLYGSMTLPWLFFCPSFGKSFTSPYSSDSLIFLFNSSLKWE